MSASRSSNHFSADESDNTSRGHIFLFCLFFVSSASSVVTLFYLSSASSAS